MRAYNDFSSVPNGSQLTTGNSAGTGLTTLDSATSGVEAAMVSSIDQQLRGKRSLKISTGPTTAASNTLGWQANTLGAPTVLYAQIYAYFPANPAANVTIMRFTQGGTANLIASVLLMTTGKLRINDSAGTQLVSTVGTVPLAGWVRIQVRITWGATTGSAELRMFSGANLESTTPTETVTSTAVGVMTGSGVVDNIRAGNTNALVNVGPYYLLDFEVRDTGYPDPLGGAVVPVARVSADQSVNPGDRVTLDGSASSYSGTGTMTYAWTQTGGTTVTLTGPTTATPTFTAPSVTGGDVLTFQLVVSAGGSSSSPVTTRVSVAPPAATGVAALTLANDFTGVPDGVQLTAANSGSTGSNAFDTATSGTDATMVASSIRQIRSHRSLAVTTGPTAASNVFGWSAPIVGSQAQLYAQVYLYIPALPTANWNLLRFSHGGTTNNNATLVLLTSGLLRMLDAAGNTMVTTAAALPVGGWVRVQVALTASATVGKATIRTFVGAALESATPTEAPSSAATFDTYAGGVTGGLTDTIRFGNTNVLSSQGPIYFADVAVSNQAYPAALGSAAPPTPNAGAAQTGVEPWATVTLDASASTAAAGTSIAGYTWTQIAGPTVAIVGAGAKVTFEAPGTTAGTTLTFRVTVTNNTGGSATDTVDVTVLGATEFQAVGGAWIPLRTRLL